MIDALKKYLPKPVRRTVRQALLLKRDLPPYLTWKWRMRDDPLFRLSNIDQGLKGRPTSATRTPEQRLEVAQRIINAYRSASSHQAGKSGVYHVSNEWIWIFREPLRPL